MQLIRITLFSSLLLAGSLSAAVSVPNEAIFERANPQIVEKTTAKRATPTVGDGIDLSNRHKGGKLFPNSSVNGAFDNALTLLRNAITKIDSSIFAKYFDVADRDLVLNVFRRLSGEDGLGAAELANIVVKWGEDDLNDPIPAALEGYNDPNPNLTITDDAW